MVDQDARLARALATIGADEHLRGRFLEFCREVETTLAHRDFSVRDEVTGALIDAVHANAGLMRRRLKNGLEFHFYYRSKIAREFVMSPEAEPDHVWEPQTTRLLLYLGRNADHAVIGGAYFGDQAILLAKEMQPNGGLCHCFEPNADQIQLLLLNARSNNLDNLVFNQMGLWDTDNAHLVLVGDDAFPHPEPVSSGDDNDTFPTISLDTYGARHGIDHLALLMLDIEGGELPALKGAARYLADPPGRAGGVGQIGPTIRNDSVSLLCCGPRSSPENTKGARE